MVQSADLFGNDVRYMAFTTLFSTRFSTETVDHREQVARDEGNLT